MAAPWLEDGYFESLEDSEHIASKCVGIASDIKDGRAGVATLVEKLSVLLASNESEARRRGTHILTSVLQALPPGLLRGEELQLLVAFFCDRLKDHHSVLPATLEGILAVVSMTYLPAAAPVALALAIFQNVPGSSQTQADRFTLYRILQVLIDTRNPELLEAGPDFVYGVLSTVDGERDPRNLMFVFSMLPRFIATFPLGHLVEEMFEVIACYFPVDFRMNADDPSSISRDELAHELQKCLVASPQFSEWCVPLLMEKMESTLRQAKIDSLRLLVAGCEVFPPASLQASWSKLWHLLFPELLPGTDQELREEALLGVQALVRAASMQADQAFLRLLLSTLLSATETCVCDAELSLFAPAIGLLLAVSQVSPRACSDVAAKVVPQLVEQYRSRSEVRERVILLQALTSFLSVCVAQEVPATGEAAADGIVALYVEAGRDVSTELRGEALRGLAALARVVSDAARPQVYQLLCDRLRLESVGTAMREVVACLKCYAGARPGELLGSVRALERQLDEGLLAGRVEEVGRCVEGLGEVAADEPLLSHIAPGMLQRILEPRHPSLCPIVARSLRRAAESEDGGERVSRFLHTDCSAVSRLVAWWRGDPAPELLGDPAVVADLAAVVLAVVRALDPGTQSSLVTEHVPVFVNPSSTLLIEPSSPHYMRSVTLLEALLAGLHQDVAVPRLEELVSRLQQIALHCADGLPRTCASRLLASFTNKADGLWLLASLEGAVEGAEGACELVAWVCKALVMRGHPDADRWTGRLVTLLSSPAEGRAAALGFQLVLEDDPHLSPRCHCNVRLLYRQRFFQTVLDHMPAFSSIPEHTRSSYLLMLAHLIQGVPPAVINSCLRQLLPLLVESLVQEEPALLLSSARMLCGLLRQRHPALEEHVQTLISRFLTLSVFPRDMNVRIAVLEGLLHVCRYPTHLLLPLKKQVVQGLARCVDDSKRLVRRAAVTARNRWFLVGTPAEPSQS